MIYIYDHHGRKKQGGSMDDCKKASEMGAIGEITPEFRQTLNETRQALKGSERRKFMAKIVRLLGPGGQRRAERELGWNRGAIVKGEKELSSSFDCVDNFSGRGRKPTEHRLSNLSADIKSIVEPLSQADPTFRTDQSYCPLTAGEVRRRLIDEMGYDDRLLPTERTIRTKLNQLGFKPQKTAKTKPKKK
jgi:hypothetical protein